MIPPMIGVFRVVRDARSGATDDGREWAQARVMASRSEKNEQGEWETQARLFLTVKARPWQVETVAALRQGDDVFLHGDPFTDEYVGRDGQPRADLVMYPREIRRIASDGPPPGHWGGGTANDGKGYGSGSFTGGVSPWA